MGIYFGSFLDSHRWMGARCDGWVEQNFRRSSGGTHICIDGLLAPSPARDSADLGFRADNFVRALKLLALPVLVFAGFALIVGWRLGGQINFFRWRPSRYLVVQLLIGFLWALAQQYVLQGFLNRRAMIFSSPWASALLVGVIFGALHLPNVWLAVITLLAGTVWVAIYQRAPNLFALAISHAVMTWFIVSILPPSLLQHLRVGLRYFG